MDISEKNFEATIEAVLTQGLTKSDAGGAGFAGDPRAWYADGRAGIGTGSRKITIALCLVVGDAVDFLYANPAEGMGEVQEADRCGCQRPAFQAADLRDSEPDARCAAHDTNFKFYKQVTDDQQFGKFFLDWLFERYQQSKQVG